MYLILKNLFIVAICFAAFSLEAQNPAPSAAAPASPAAASTPPAALLNDPVLQQRIEENLRARFRIPPAVTMEISAPRPSEFPGYDQITVTLVGNGHRSPNDFLLSKDRATLAQLHKIDLSKDPFTVENRPMRGTADAKVKVIVYDDFECPYCAKGYQILFNDVLPEYKDKVMVVYKDFPLYEIHPWAIHAAVNANCLGAQSTDAYWAFADYVHANQESISGEKRPLPDQFAALDRAAAEYGKKSNVDTERLQACVKTQDETTVRASIKYGEETLGVEATPTLFINGTKLDGAVPPDDLRSVLNAALEKAGVLLPAAEIKAKSEIGSKVAPGSLTGGKQDADPDKDKKGDPKSTPGTDPKK